eukprot:1161140-Pelagomonas_calceolata.AAC.15
MKRSALKRQRGVNSLEQQQQDVGLNAFELEKQLVQSADERKRLVQKADQIQQETFMIQDKVSCCACKCLCSKDSAALSCFAMSV